MQTEKKRFVILDALRALAGLTVPLFHIYESLANTPAKYESICGHGYLAVEFFLLLMGYMLAYAYDARWEKGMGLWDFFKRRLIRLHPLVISGVLLGLLVCLGQQLLGVTWMSWWQERGWGEILLVALWTATMVPVVGYGLINPFNACSWTLYYEYAGNILYALGLRKLGKKALLVGVVVSAFFWIAFVLHINLNSLFGTHLPLLDKVAVSTRWSIVGGWSDAPHHVYCGFVRLALPLFLGLLLARLNWRIRIPKGALWIAVGIFFAVLYTPHSYKLGGEGHYWVNAIFEIMAILVVFPVLILVGVGSPVASDTRFARVIGFLAELSYPLYMSHFMFMGVFRWVLKSLGEGQSALLLPISFVYYLVLIGVAYLMMRFWDQPIQRLFKKSAATEK